MGLPDPRTFGSGNPGATNVLRSGKKTAAALTLLGDCSKGWLAVFLVQHLFATEATVAREISLAAIAVVAGHIYPVFHGFQGGKGVSTALGALLAINVWLAAATAATWFVIAFFFRISSLAALIAAASAPFFCYLLYGLHPFTGAVGVIALALIWRHKSNIKKLLAGTEGRLGEKRA
jgi:glycerol-3-phosphate acyltransferase PlsY